MLLNLSFCTNITGIWLIGSFNKFPVSNIAVTFSCLSLKNIVSWLMSFLGTKLVNNVVNKSNKSHLEPCYASCHIYVFLLCNMYVSIPVHSKGDQPWVFFGRNDAKAETPVIWSPDELTHWKRLWCWEGLGAGREGDDRGWDGWMISPTRWMWVWVNSGSWWWTGRPGVLSFMGSQRVGHDWATELNWKWSENSLPRCIFSQLFTDVQQ